jgi:hypothetical protein
LICWRCSARREITADAWRRAKRINYRKAIDLRRCLLLNFGDPLVEIRRVANGV